MKIVVFVVDDEAFLVANVVRVLRNFGHEVHAETDPTRALAILLSDMEIDVTFLDLVMPDVSGGAIFEELRAKAPARCQRIIFFTGNSFLVEQWLTRTGQPVLEKPVDIGLLERKVREFGRLQLPRGPQMPPPEPKPSHPELPALYDDDMDVNTDMLKVAETMGKRRSIPRDVLEELRFRYLHTSHKEVKRDVKEIKDTVQQQGKWQDEVKATIKTTTRLAAAAIVVCGAAWELFKTFVLHK